MDTTGFEVMDFIVEVKGTSDYTAKNDTVECGVDVYHLTKDYDGSRVEVWYDYMGYTFWGLYGSDDHTPRYAYVKTNRNVFCEIDPYHFDDITTAIMAIINAGDESDDLLIDCVDPKLYKALDDWHDKLHEIYL